MSDLLVIAPTHSYYRDPEHKPVNDTIKNQEDAVNVEEKQDNLIPEGTSHAPKEFEHKRYHDMRPIHIGEQRAEDAARRDFAEKENTKWINGVSYPETGQSSNERYMRGLHAD